MAELRALSDAESLRAALIAGHANAGTGPVIHSLDLKGFKVSVKSLRRSDVLAIRDKQMTVAELEQYLISKAMVYPPMSMDDVRAWQESDGWEAGDLEPLCLLISEISGLEDKAIRKAYAQFRDAIGIGDGTLHS